MEVDTPSSASDEPGAGYSDDDDSIEDPDYVNSDSESTESGDIEEPIIEEISSNDLNVIQDNEETTQSTDWNEDAKSISNFNFDHDSAGIKIELFDNSSLYIFFNNCGLMK